MLTLDQIADILNSNFKINALLENSNLLQIDDHIINKLNQDKKDLEIFFNENKNFNFQNIENIPDNIRNIIDNIKELIKNIPAEKTEIIHGLNINNKPLKALIEIYTSESNFLNFMNNINLEKFITELKNELPEEFKKYTNLESMLRKGFSNYDSVLTIPLSNNIDSFIQDTHNQFKDNNFSNHVEKMYLGSFNYKIVLDLMEKLSQKNQDKYDINFFLFEKSHLNLQSHIINVAQRLPRYKILLDGAIQNLNSDEKTIKIKQNKELLDKNLEDISEKALELNKLTKSRDYYSIKNIPIDNYQDMNKMYEIVEKKQKVINNSISGTISRINYFFNKANNNLIKKNNPIYKTQISGHEKIIEKLNSLKDEYNKLEYIKDSEIQIFSQLENVIKETEDEIPGFKANKNVNIKLILKKIDELQKNLKNEFHLDDKSTYFFNQESKSQNETVIKMQLNLLNEIIDQVDKAIEEAQKKCALYPENHRLQEKQTGLEELRQSYTTRRGNIIANPDKMTYTRLDNLGEMMTKDIHKQKKQHPLLTAGIFSKNKQILKQIESRIHQHQASIDRAINDKSYAERISKSVDDKFNNPKPR